MQAGLWYMGNIMEKINVTVYPHREQKKQGDLFGIFFEDLNHAADGGLYGELIRNRSFEFDPVDREGYHGMTAWEQVARGNSAVCAHVETREPLHPQNPHYLVFEVLTEGTGGGIRNMGFEGGIQVRSGESYFFSCFYKLQKGMDAPIEVRLESRDGERCYAKQTFQPEKGKWRQFFTALCPDGTDAGACLTLLAKQPVCIAFDMVSLFPANTFRGRRNGIRADLAKMLADMKPKFMRFPGGCLTHIGSLDADDRSGMYRWKKTVGPVEERPARRNTWNYNQSMGLGFYEYFLLCEDIGAEPLPVISAGYDPHNLRVAPLNAMQEWIDEALDLIEFANGDKNTKWGSIRAGMGHPEPFHMKYLGIGNEEVGDAYFERYEIIAAEVKRKYPEISLINSAGPGSGGSEFAKGWEQARRGMADLVDEHYYQCPEWFIANADRYQAYDTVPGAFLGEYGSCDDSWKNALAEAAFMTGLEKAEGMHLACYAPLLCNVNYQNWHPDLIYFDHTKAYGSPSYYVQKLFMQNQGTALVMAKDDIKTKPQKVPVLSGKIGMRTQNAQVEIRDFCFEGEGGIHVVKEVPDFVLSEKNNFFRCLETDCDSYTVSFRFQKRNGSLKENLEGQCSFELEFAGADDNNKLIWRIDGWQRLTALYGMVEGKICDLDLHLFESETGKEYEAKLVVDGNHVRTYLDGILYCEHTCKSCEPEPLYYSAVKDENQDVIVKVVNVENMEKEIDITLEQAGVDSGTVTIFSMENFDLMDKNSFEEPEKVVPIVREDCFRGGKFQYVAGGDSLAVLIFHCG